MMPYHTRAARPSICPASVSSMLTGRCGSPFGERGRRAPPFPNNFLERKRIYADQNYKEYFNATPSDSGKVSCCCGQSREVRLCPCDDCPLYPYRLGRNPNSKRQPLNEEQKAILANRLSTARRRHTQIDFKRIFPSGAGKKRRHIPGWYFDTALKVFTKTC